MTEQPSQALSEERWLGNTADVAPTPLRQRVEQPVDLLAAPDLAQSTPALAQRVAPPKLTPPTPLRPEPVISATYPYEIAQANILLRKAVTAAAKLANARAAAKAAEDAAKKAEHDAKDALLVEELAEVAAVEADRDLLDFVREAAGK